MHMNIAVHDMISAAPCQLQHWCVSKSDQKYGKYNENWVQLGTRKCEYPFNGVGARPQHR